MNYFIIVFKNTHDAMSGEKKLLQENYSIRIMPTPTAITQSCGICIRIEDEKQIQKIINEDSLTFKGIYKKTSEGYIEIR